MHCIKGRVANLNELGGRYLAKMNQLSNVVHLNVSIWCKWIYRLDYLLVFPLSKASSSHLANEEKEEESFL